MAYPNPFELSIRTIRQGRDYIWLVSGGEAHTGAVAVAYWHGETADAPEQILCNVCTVPSHKEGELAQELAELACRRLKATVTVAAGIHIDCATKEEIRRIVEEVRRLARKELDFLTR